MSDPISDDYLRQIKDRCDRATPPPWIREPYSSRNPNCEAIRVPVIRPPKHSVAYLNGQAEYQISTSMRNYIANADFIANARADIPALLHEVARLREKLEQIRSDELAPPPGPAAK